MQSVKENRTRLLLGVKGEVCSEEAQNKLKTSLTKSALLEMSGNFAGGLCLRMCCRYCDNKRRQD